MENKTNLTPLHCIFYIYQTFAYGSDGKLTDKEKQSITNFMYRWVGQNQEKMLQIINETLAWSKENIKTYKEQIGSMVSMVEFLKEQKEFSVNRREFFLMDIRHIARADGNFSDEEKQWHDMLAKALEMEIRISKDSHQDIQGSLKKVKRKKIGFRRLKP